MRLILRPDVFSLHQTGGIMLVDSRAALNFGSWGEEVCRRVRQPLIEMKRLSAVQSLKKG
jgi:hypothetical protein